MVSSIIRKIDDPQHDFQALALLSKGRSGGRREINLITYEKQ